MKKKMQNTGNINTGNSAHNKMKLNTLPAETYDENDK